MGVTVGPHIKMCNGMIDKFLANECTTSQIDR